MSPRTHHPCLAVAALALLLFSTHGRSAGVDYLKSVKPLLQERCYACHGALKQKGGLRLDTATALRKGGESGPAILPGNPSRSPLLERVESDDPSEHMPPPHEGERLKPGQVQLLRAWINEGAPAPDNERPEPDPRDHWAFRPRARPPVPADTGDGWARNPIDRFLAAGHAARGLKPLPEAPRDVLLRRLYLDLVGVPPNAAETQAAAALPPEHWYETTVEALLADPRHGQRWGRHWMDIWRYSDWWGLGAQLRNSQKHMWHWRDWIVESLNADLPYDEMVRLMLAADELAPADPQKLRATGFLARNWFLFNRNTWLEETVEHVGKGLLGLTLNCAKCHDHKYDPVSQADFYRLRAFFEPYHVRLDVTPDSPDLERDGIPRAFDAAPATPTYRFVRGEESNPDKSAELAPAVPALFALGEMRIHAVPLPPEAAEPERQPWVLESHLREAKASFEKARSALEKARQKAQAPAGANTAGPDAATADKPDPATHAAELACRLAEAELRSVEKRAVAMRARWSAAPDADAHRSGAVQAEREAAAAKQRLAVAEARTRAQSAAPEKKEAAEKALATAEAQLEKAIQATGSPVQPGDQFTPLHGAKWTPTRFLSSGKDDPTPPFPRTSTGRRKALAEWITDPRHPLTARVAVNHLWGRHMGTPLAPNEFDFGRKSPAPAHPALLDWLASELVEHGWSLKHVHRLIVTSAAYRLSSSMAAPTARANLQADPDNTLLWRRAPLRLEAEVVRDSILSLAGELDCAEGGPPIPPAAQADSKRRSLYFQHSNNERNLFLSTFDAATVKECYRREQSIVPQQALALSNSRLVHEAAPKIAARLSRDCAPGDDAFARAAWCAVLGAQANAQEVAACAAALQGWRADAAAAGNASAGVAEALARSRLVWTLLNHNDFVTLR